MTPERSLEKASYLDRAGVEGSKIKKKRGVKEKRGI